ncbi:MAG: DUF5979 domain-containing protein [Lachnospiraceae bacterium]|nr:DUF5979 domain-containing protein [Lachnospiraceae bacterium]
MNKWKSAKSAFIKKILACTVALGLCIGGTLLSPIITDAANKLDLSAACNLTVNATSSTDKVFLDDIAKAGVVVDLYKVADAEKTDGYDAYTFKVADTYKNALTIPDNVDAKVWSELANKAAKVVKDKYNTTDAIVPTATAKEGQQIKSISAGLYLVIARGEKITDYFVETTLKDADGNPLKDAAGNVVSEITTIAEGEENSYSFIPEFVALPTKAPDPKTGEINMSADTDWIYTAQVSLKPTWEPRYGDLKIIKDLLTYEKSEPTYFVFSVEATKKYGDTVKNVFSNVYTLSFSKYGKEELTIKNIPAGSEVTVTEIYSGCNYKLVSAASQMVVIEANQVKDVEFVNDYGENDKHCGAITNHFDPVLDANGNVVLDDNGKPKYTWAKYGDSREEGI